jgi:hypothetical protein
LTKFKVTNIEPTPEGWSVDFMHWSGACICEAEKAHVLVKQERRPLLKDIVDAWKAA